MTESGKILLDTVKHKKTDVLGLGISNIPLIEFLLSCGARITARDAKPEDKLPPAARAAAARCERLVTGENYLSGLDGDIIFRSPGIRPDAPELAAAVAGGALLCSEAELYFELCECRTVGITGSDGKTTTTTVTSLLLNHAARLSGKSSVACVGGNIGVPLVLRLAEITERDTVVAELSSFQLQSMTRSPSVAVITNVTPNHLNWHTGMEEYIEAKRNIYLHPDCKRLVTNAANAITAGLAANCTLPVTLFSSRGKPEGGDCRIWLENGSVLCEGDCVQDSGTAVLLEDTAVIRLPGLHNIENYMAACGVLLACGYSPCVTAAAFLAVARNFGGVEHRLEHVAQIDGADYYNSSIDSTPARCAAALSVFPDGRNILICGGYDKHIPFTALAEALCDRACAVVLTGATADMIYKSIESMPPERRARLRVLREPDFEAAVRLAASLAFPGGRVILSPACASFDAFANFEERGRRFKEIILGIAGNTKADNI